MRKEASEEMVELLKQLQQATQEADEARSSWPCFFLAKASQRSKMLLKMVSSSSAAREFPWRNQGRFSCGKSEKLSVSVSGVVFLRVFEFDFGLLYVQGHVEDRTMMSSIVLMLGSKAALITHPKQQGYCLGSGTSLDTHSSIWSKRHDDESFTLIQITMSTLGVMTIAQKRGPPHKFYPCSVKYQSKNGDCTKDDCKAECTRKKNGIGSCIGPPGRRWCACVEMDGGSQNGAYDGRVMTEEQMEILSKQIAIYAAICRQLVSLHESFSSKLPLSSGVDPTGGGYFDSMGASPSTYKISHRHRWTPTSMQLQILESIYEEGSGTPKPQRIEEITLELSQHGQVMDKNVYNWFQNRRARSKRKQPQAMTTTTVQTVDAVAATEERSYGDSGGDMAFQSDASGTVKAASRDYGRELYVNIGYRKHSLQDPDSVLGSLTHEIKEVGPDGQEVTKVVPAVTEEDQGIEILTEAIAACTETIDQHKGKLVVKETPRARTEHMAKLRMDDEEISGDEEEDTGMGEVDIEGAGIV
ncbi:hypothetical protein HID58_063265, partial [Brassica napus]